MSSMFVSMMMETVLLVSAAGSPIRSRNTFGWPGISLPPAPYAMLSIFMAGKGPKDEAREVRITAPVGVVSSKGIEDP